VARAHRIRYLRVRTIDPIRGQTHQLHGGLASAALTSSVNDAIADDRRLPQLGSA
jgi:hypothetical protein